MLVVAAKCKVLAVQRFLDTYVVMEEAGGRRREFVISHQTSPVVGRCLIGFQLFHYLTSLQEQRRPL